MRRRRNLGGYGACLATELDIVSGFGLLVAVIHMAGGWGLRGVKRGYIHEGLAGGLAHTRLGKWADDNS